MIIREAKIADAEKILEIYGPYVLNTAISFEYEVPPVEEFQQRIANVQEKFPYLVAEEQGEIIGYCYAAPFHARKAYERSVETTIYISRESRRHGLGKKMYELLEERLRNQGIKNLYACVAYPNGEDEFLTTDSVRFHEKMGYEICGHLHKCGYKFGHWYDMLYMEKIIG